MQQQGMSKEPKKLQKKVSFKNLSRPGNRKVPYTSTSNRSISIPLISPWGFPGGSAGKEPACSAGDMGLIPGSGRSPGGGQATHSNILAWRIPWTGEAGELHSSWCHKQSDTNEQLTQHYLSTSPLSSNSEAQTK